jgi:hypothetical protein
MQTAMKGTLTGVKRSKGEGAIEGKNVQWDYTAFYIMSELPAAKGNSRGQATQEYRFGAASEYDKWLKVPLPCVVDVDIAMVTNGKGGHSIEVLGLKTALEQPGRKAA